MRHSKKKAEWKETNAFLFTPRYTYSLPVRNRYVFFWCKAANYRKTINFAEKFTAPYNICAVYIWGDLNPDWVEWLMGLPVGWTDIGE